MRLWSLHPCYLDAKGLVALWREALLAQAVISGLTRGYTHHPQLRRFLDSPSPAAAIASYLQAVQAEATARGYRFDVLKIGSGRATAQIAVTDGQMDYEWQHLLAKLRVRDPARLERFATLERPDAHPLFHVVPGPVAAWEVIQPQEKGRE